MVAARIIKQYVSYCKEIEFNHLSERELYRVLKYCPAQQKKALQGLDNISADGLRGVEKLANVTRKLGERGNSSEWVTGVINLLMAFKSYLNDSWWTSLPSRNFDEGCWKINSTMCMYLWSQSMPGNVIC